MGPGRTTVCYAMRCDSIGVFATIAVTSMIIRNKQTPRFIDCALHEALVGVLATLYLVD